MTTRLHFIYDPLCGWCYASEPLAAAAATLDGLDVVLHGGGLWPEPVRLPEATRRYIEQVDARIAKLSGQAFGDAYLRGSLLDPTLTLDSGPPTAAVLAAEALERGSALRLLRGIQRAHYVDGRRVVEREVLCDIAVASGFARDAFSATLDRVDAPAHIAATRGLMDRVGATGFPAFVLERGRELQPIAHSEFLGKPLGFSAFLIDVALYVPPTAARG